MQENQIISLENAKELSIIDNPIVKSRVFGANNINRYQLKEGLIIKLSNNKIIQIPVGYVWDLASVPRILWWLFPPDSDAELAFLIHDFLYEEKYLSKEETDLEMLIWSKQLNGTSKKSIRNIDNELRYLAVKWFGKKKWDT